MTAVLALLESGRSSGPSLCPLFGFPLPATSVMRTEGQSSCPAGDVNVVLLVKVVFPRITKCEVAIFPPHTLWK